MPTLKVLHLCGHTVYYTTWCIISRRKHQLCFSLIVLSRLGIRCSVAVFLDVTLIVASCEGGCEGMGQETGIKCGLLGKVSPRPTEASWSSRG